MHYIPPTPSPILDSSPSLTPATPSTTYYHSPHTSSYMCFVTFIYSPEENLAPHPLSSSQYSSQLFSSTPQHPFYHCFSLHPTNTVLSLCHINVHSLPSPQSQVSLPHHLINTSCHPFFLTLYSSSNFTSLHHPHTKQIRIFSSPSHSSSLPSFPSP